VHGSHRGRNVTVRGLMYGFKGTSSAVGLSEFKIYKNSRRKVNVCTSGNSITVSYDALPD
jgi:hypothetical protein